MATRTIPVIAVLSLCLFPITPEAPQLNSLSEIAAVAVANNHTLKEAIREMEKLDSSLPSYWKLDNTSVSLTGSTREVALGQEWSGTASLTLPIVDQAGLGASINSDTSGKVSLSVLPIAHSDRVTQGKISLTLQEAKVQQQHLLTGNEAIAAALGWLASVERMEIQLQRSELRERDYREMRIRFEGGGATLSEVEAALKSWTEAQREVVVVRERLRVSRLALEESLGLQEFRIYSITSTEVEEAIEQWKREIIPEEKSASSSYPLLVDTMAVESTRAKLQDTWVFDPELKGDVSALWDQNGEWSFSGSLALNFSWQDIKVKERAELQDDLLLLEEKLEATRRTEMENLRQAIDNLEKTSLNREITGLLLSQSQEIEEEATALYRQGKLSETELADANLNTEEAELALFESLSEELAAWLRLRTYR